MICCLPLYWVLIITCMKHHIRKSLFLLFLLPACWKNNIMAQSTGFSTKGFWQPAGPAFSPEVHSNGEITFRMRGPEAKKVSLLFGEWDIQQKDMKKDSTGVWSITIGPVQPGIYSYLFSSDGVKTADLANPVIKRGTELYGSIVEVTGNGLAFDEWQQMPHGSIHIIRYASKSLKRLRSMYVYLPAEYLQEPGRKFPVLYLRHGGGDNESSWTQESGRADVILENLVAAKKAVPMIIVMPYGLTDGSWAGGSTKEGMELLEEELLRDIMPYIGTHYRVMPGRENTAIAGLSMGGGQAYIMGLRHLEKFAWIGQFSSGLLSDENFDINERAPGIFNHPSDINRKLRLLWIGCGKDDPRMPGHTRLAENLNTQGIKHTVFNISGGHEWKVWRLQLHAFLQQLFK